MGRVPIRSIATVVHSVTAQADDVLRIELREPTGWSLPPFQPGAHIDLHLQPGLIRTYSLCGDPAQDDRYVLAIKREAAGRGGSRWIFDNLGIGTPLNVSLPRGGIAIGDDQQRHVMLAGGIGVTPFLSLLHALRRAGRNNAMLHVISRGTPPLADDLATFIDAGQVTLHDTSRGPRPRIDALIGAPESTATVSCCGPITLLDAFERHTLSWPADQVHTERFVAPPVKIDPQARAFTLVLAKSGKSCEVPPGGTVLSALRQLQVDVDVSCEGGLCGLCKVGWLEGEPVFNDRVLTPGERNHSLMACVASCQSEKLVLDL